MPKVQLESKSLRMYTHPMASFPSGTVTFLFTDIEGSTRLAQQYPDKIIALLARHNEILTHSIQAQNGYVFQIVGDSFAAAFHSANEALNAAVSAQRMLYNEPWNPAPLKVRMGLHTGTAHLNDASAPTVYAEYSTLASTQRIMSAGHGGQILLSSATRELVRDALPIDTELQGLGAKRLKDLLRPEHLFQLNIAGLPTNFPPLKTLDAFLNNLPTQLTTFIGRENEMAEVKKELETHRLVTLTGSGGTGKTRLSLQVAADVLDRFPQGVWFIELAPLADPELIPQTILSAIGISKQKGKSLVELLKGYLQEKKTLIILDNCEHLIEASARLANSLLSSAPGLKIMASSRETLGIDGEVAYPVPSLSLPDVKHLPMSEQLSQYEAVRLFIDRASLVSPHFVVDKDNAPFIAQICYRLDGIPLAIELAAARVKMLSVEQISRRLDDRFRLLTGGARTALPRQQTLRALIDWSYDLLSEKERFLLHRLSVFAGGWTLEAAEEICAGDGIETDAVLDLLTQLVNKSLVVVMERSQSGETRYRMLETIRQYAREKLLKNGNGEAIRQQHLAYFVRLVEQAEPELYRSHQVYWLNKLDDELDNLRLALEWALTANVEAGLRIASLPWRFWSERGYLRELGDWLSQLLKRSDRADSLHAKALVIYSFCFFRQGDFSETIRIAEQSLRLARTLSDRQMEAFSMAFLGVFTLTQGNMREGTQILEQSLALYKALNDRLGQAMAMSWLALGSNDVERGMALVGESLAIYREFGHLTDIASSLFQLARLAIWRGDFSSPAPWLEEALSISLQLGNQISEEEALITQGNLAYRQGNYDRACTYYEEAISLGEKIGDFYHLLWVRAYMAYVVLRQGNFQRARALFEDSIRQTQKADLMIATVYAIEGLASLNVQQGQPHSAARLFAWADAMREKIGDQRPPVEQDSVEGDLEIIHSELSDPDVERLSAEGKAMALDQALAYALEGISD
jgi:predicted ATPase/class 3 adenylate cyclase